MGAAYVKPRAKPCPKIETAAATHADRAEPSGIRRIDALQRARIIVSI
jgi:hypothetical protein